MTRPALPDFFARDGRAVVVAIDHPLYSWPHPGLEDPVRVMRAVAPYADGIIASYGMIQRLRGEFGQARPILKLDLTSLTVGQAYAVTEYVLAWTLEDALRLGVRTVLTYIQLGPAFELEALRVAARLAADCDRLGLCYLCEIMPALEARYPDLADPVAIAASCRTAAELGAHAIKTTLPNPPGAMGQAIAAACGVPVILAGGGFMADRAALYAGFAEALAQGAAGVAFGRNVWGDPDPGAVTRRLAALVHGDAQASAGAAAGAAAPAGAAAA